MPGRETHGQDCIGILGKPFYHVHMFLDQYTSIFPPPLFYDYHRSLLHNSYGLALVGRKWGHKAYLAAKIHLARDYDDTVPTEKLLDVANRAIMWFNNLEHMELHLKPYYMSAWEECLVSAIEEKGNTILYPKED